MPYRRVLHTSLVALAHEAGHVCDHVNFLGLGGQKVWQLMTTIRCEEYTFVTNNRADFASFYAKEKLHVGPVIILPALEAPRRLAGSTTILFGRARHPMSSITERARLRFIWNGSPRTQKRWDFGRVF
jgi:hypothetical protein